jgi:hypothetical protein
MTDPAKQTGKSIQQLLVIAALVVIGQNPPLQTRVLPERFSHLPRS